MLFKFTSYFVKTVWQFLDSFLLLKYCITRPFRYHNFTFRLLYCGIASRFSCISLGSTRFLKVARATAHSGEGNAANNGFPGGTNSVVVKVFTLQELGLNLKAQRDQLLELRRALEGCVNCLPFQRVFVSRMLFHWLWKDCQNLYDYSFFGVRDPQIFR